jgi:hypothetical protein
LLSRARAFFIAVHKTPEGAAEGCDLLILYLKKQNQKIAAFGSSYKSGSIKMPRTFRYGAFLLQR